MQSGEPGQRLIRDGVSTAQRIRRIGSFVAFLLATMVIVYGIGGQWQAIIDHVGRLDASAALVSVLVGSSMMFFSGMNLSILAKPGSRDVKQLLAITRIYLAAQLLKYLPGRVWALVYQIDKVRKVTGGRMALAASLSHMFLSAFGSIVVFGAALDPGPLVWPFALVVICLWLWRGGMARYMGIGCEDWASFRHVLGIVVLLVLEWLAFAATALLALHSIGLGDEYSLSLIALYSISWIVGSLSMLTPGGLVVREGGFILLCQLNGISPEVSGAFAVVARMVFTLSELVAAAISRLMPELAEL